MKGVLSFPGLEQKLKTLSGNSSFADAKSQKDAETLMDEVNVCRVHFLTRGLFLDYFSARLPCLRLLPAESEQLSRRAEIACSYTGCWRAVEASYHLEMFTFCKRETQLCPEQKSPK